jgi:hypothetical protein
MFMSIMDITIVNVALPTIGRDFLVNLPEHAQTIRQAQRILDAVRQVVEATGVHKGKARRALDSTLLEWVLSWIMRRPPVISVLRRGMLGSYGQSPT